MEVSSTILTLSRHRWNVPLVARLGRSHGESFGSLVRGLAISRDSLSRSLRAVAAPGWVARGSARPSLYRITPAGRSIAPRCERILRVADAGDVRDLSLRRWTLPIARALDRWRLRFAQLRAMLPGITPRALALALKEMQAAGLVEREVIGGFPPTASYALTPLAKRLLPPLRELQPG